MILAQIYLGAGTGAASNLIASTPHSNHPLAITAPLRTSHTLPTSITITDLPQLLPLMKMNIEANKHQSRFPVTARVLQWGTSDVDGFEEHFDYIIGAGKLGCMSYLALWR